MSLINKCNYCDRRENGFTIVELLVVIVIIGILAAITMVSYAGITDKATAATLQSDLKNASTQLEMDKTINGTYPSSAAAANNGAGLKASNGTTLSYVYYNETDSYSLVATNKGKSYFVTSSNELPIVGNVPSFDSFATVLGTADDDNWESVAQTNDGGFVVAGEVSKIVNYMVDTDIFLAKYNAAGSLVWSKLFVGGPHLDEGSSIIQTSDGGFAITGTTLGDAYDPSMLLAKFDINGDFVWAKILGYSDYDSEFGKDLVQTSDGGYVVAGTGSFYDSTNDIYYEDDIYLAKFDSIGGLSWIQTYTNSLNGQDSVGHIINTSDGGLAIAGSIDDGDSQYYAYFAKLNASGGISWQKTWGNGNDNGYEDGRSIVQTNDGNYIAVGSTDAHGAGNTDVFIAKYDVSGNLLWNKTLGGSGIDYPVSAVKTDDGGFALTGKASSFSHSLFITKYDSAGSLSWAKTFGGGGQDLSSSIIQTSDGGYSIVGDTTSYGIGQKDALLLKYSNNGTISGCGSGMCDSITFTETTPTVLTATPDVAAISQAGNDGATVTDWTLVLNSLTPTVTIP